MSQLFVSGGQSTGASASASVLAMNIQDWFFLGRLVWSCCPRDSQASSLAPQFKSTFWGLWNRSLKGLPGDRRRKHLSRHCRPCWSKAVTWALTPVLLGWALPPTPGIREASRWEEKGRETQERPFSVPTQCSPARTCMLSRFSRVRLFETLWTVACQAPLSKGLSKYWSGLPEACSEPTVTIRADARCGVQRICSDPHNTHPRGLLWKGKEKGEMSAPLALGLAHSTCTENPSWDCWEWC